MNLLLFLNQLVEAFGFTDEEQEEVVKDLSNVISIKFAAEISESGQDVSGLTKAIESGNKQDLIQAFNELAKKPGNDQLMDKITIDVISSWTESVLPNLSPEEQLKATDAMKRLVTPV